VRARTRWTAVIGSAAVIVVAVLGVAVWRPTAGAPAPERDPIATATIVRQTLTDTVTVNGKLAFGPPIAAESRLAGTLTELAAIGTTVRRGQILFRIDDTPVLLFYGDVPAYRELTAGKAAVPSTVAATAAATAAVPASHGRDVKQFEQNLKALGYKGFTVDEDYTPQTAAAVRRWQEDLGLPRTGVVELGRVFYGPGPIRVADHKLVPGQVATAAVLSYTGTVHLVTAQIPAVQEGLVKISTKVTVQLPNGTDLDGTVRSVRTPDDQAGQEPMVEAVVAVAADAADADDGPVKVRITVDQKENVLAVPVGALLALAEGGYGVQIVDGATARIVAVTTGLFADGQVEVGGPDIRAGQTVGMAR
jgi:multidrug efflux system membrane fusion protein